jgi:hypothetical protein
MSHTTTLTRNGPSGPTKVTYTYDGPTWEDVRHWVYPGSPVDVPIWLPHHGYSDCIAFAEVEDGETYLTLRGGDVVPAAYYEAPLGWVLPKD